MPSRKRKDSGTTIGLKLTAADRKLLLEHCPSLAEDFVKAIRETPPREPVTVPLDDTDDLLECLAADAADAEDPRTAKNLDRLLDKIADFIDKTEDAAALGKPTGIQIPGWLAGLMIEGIETGKSVTLPIKPARKRDKLGLKLTQQQREAILHTTRLPNRIRQRLQDAPEGAWLAEFTRKELDAIQAEVGQAACYAPSPYKKRLLAVIGKITDALDPGGFEGYIARK